MTKEVIKFIKDYGYNEKNITYFDKEIQDKKEYDKLYLKSKGCICSDGFILFITNSNRVAVENQKLDIYLISQKALDEVFEIPISLIE